MASLNQYVDEEMTDEERKEFEEKFCHGIIKATLLTEEEIEQLKKEGRL